MPDRLTDAHREAEDAFLATFPLKAEPTPEELEAAKDYWAYFEAGFLAALSREDGWMLEALEELHAAVWPNGGAPIDWDERVREMARRLGGLCHTCGCSSPPSSSAYREDEGLREALVEIATQYCREWCEKKNNYCNAPAEFVLWGKLLKPEALGPRCYDHAASHVGHHGLYPRAHFALIDLRPGLAALAASPVASREAEGGGWRAVANDFQRAMFDERRCVEAADYLINLLKAVIARKPVRDLAEAKAAYYAARCGSRASFSSLLLEEASENG